MRTQVDIQYADGGANVHWVEDGQSMTYTFDLNRPVRHVRVTSGQNSPVYAPAPTPDHALMARVAMLEQTIEQVSKGALIAVEKLELEMHEAQSTIRLLSEEVGLK